MKSTPPTTPWADPTEPQRPTGLRDEDYEDVTMTCPECLRTLNGEYQYCPWCESHIGPEPIQYDPNEFVAGQSVTILGCGRWYPGSVVKMGPKRITVRYTTGTGRTRDKAVTPTSEVVRDVAREGSRKTTTKGPA